MAGRPKIFDEKAVLNKATNLFWTKGFEATTTDDLLATMDINRGSLYHTFGSKRELFTKSLDFFATNSIEMVELKIKENEDPIIGIKKFFIELAAADPETHKKGCFMGNTLAEMTSLDEELQSKASKNLVTLEEIFFKYITKGKQEGKLQSKEDSRVLARYLLNLWNGINITRRMYPNKQVLESIIKLQLSILN